MNKKLFSILAALILAASACQQNVPPPATGIPTEPPLASALPTVDPPQDSASHDFSALSYTEAFNKMFEIVRRDYAFKGVTGKQPDWDALYAVIHPSVEQAEQARDAQAYFLALRDFTLAFKDGHVNLGGGDIQVALFQSAIAGGYGFALRELDDGSVIVTYVTPGGPADEAGIQPCAQVTKFNGQPISVAIDAAALWGAPPSLGSSIRYQKSRYLTRAVVGTEAAVEFSNPESQSQTVTLTAVEERESFAVTSVFITYNAESLPVEFRLLPSGAGYIRINSTSDNRDLIAGLFESALRDLETANARGLVIDLRVVVNFSPDSSLPPLGLAGFLADREIMLGQLQYFNEAAGKFENEGVPQTILPNPNHYSFGKTVLLVGPGCSSSCELEAYAFSQLPGMIVVGQYPSAGVLADVTRGQFLLPEGVSLQVPTGRFILPNGGIFLEGQGVPLTVRVPVDATTVLSAEDVVLNAAEKIVVGQ
jgi:C-terminal processing protease CtpA/Prc